MWVWWVCLGDGWVGSVEKVIEGVKLSEKQKEAISKVGGGLGDPNVLKGKSDDKNKK